MTAYALPILIASMLAYMFWRAAYRLRSDRILELRSMRRLRAAAGRAGDRLRHRAAARRQ